MKFFFKEGNSTYNPYDFIFLVFISQDFLQKSEIFYWIRCLAFRSEKTVTLRYRLQAVTSCVPSLAAFLYKGKYLVSEDKQSSVTIQPVKVLTDSSLQQEWEGKGLYFSLDL